MQNRYYKIPDKLHTALKLLGYEFEPETDSHYARIIEGQYTVSFYQTPRKQWYIKQNTQPDLIQLLKAHDQTISHLIEEEL